MIRLIEPNKLFTRAIEEYKSDFISHYEKTFINGSLRLGQQSVEEFLDEVNLMHSHNFENDDFVTLPGVDYQIVYKQFLAVNELDEVIGLCIIRKYPKDSTTLNYVGNIGYSVSPKKTGKGFGKEILKLCLEEAKKLNFFNIIISVREWNIPSQKIAMNCGGVLTKTIFWPEEKVNMQIYSFEFNKN